MKQFRRSSPGTPSTQTPAAPAEDQPVQAPDELDEEKALATAPEATSSTTVRWGGMQLDEEEDADAPSPTNPPVPVVYARTEPADAAGQTADLAAGDVIGPQTRYAKVDAGGPLWLDLGLLSSTDRATVTYMLTAAGGAFTLESNALVCGTRTVTPTLTADTETPENVLATANGPDCPDAAVWGFLNGGEQVLEAEDASSAGWKEGQTKPGAWYNSYTVEGDEVQAHKSGFDTREGAAPTMDLQGMKDLIMRCMDVSGFRSAVGDDHDRFVQALRSRFAHGHPLGESAFVALCDEIWSYLRTGAGPDGSVDVGRLQACVRALSPDIEVTAETNTSFDGPAFALGSTDVTLQEGDGKFGRATMLSLMHLFGQLGEIVQDPPKIPLVPDEFHDGDYFVHDNSESMTGPGGQGGALTTVKGAVDMSQGWAPGQGMDNRTVGTFDENHTLVNGQDESGLVESLTLAYAKVFPKDLPADRAAFARWFKVAPGAIFNGQGLDARTLMTLVGEANRDYGNSGESSLKAILTVLTHPEDLPVDHPLRIRIEQGEKDPNQDPIRLNAVADEPEQGLEYLELVKALAATLHVDVRIIAVPTDNAPAIQQDPIGSLIFVDVEGLQLDPATGHAQVPYTQNGQQQTTTVRIGNMSTSATQRQQPTGYRSARLNLNAGQSIRGAQ